MLPVSTYANVTADAVMFNGAYITLSSFDSAEGLVKRAPPAQNWYGQEFPLQAAQQTIAAYDAKWGDRRSYILREESVVLEEYEPESAE